jgi:putative transcriptional regulator
MPLFDGGPVGKEQMFFLHSMPDVITGGTLIQKGIYWGGDFDVVIDLIKTKQITETDIRFFIGYSGWGEGQLAEELASKKNARTRGGSRMLLSEARVNAQEGLSSGTTLG